MPPLLRAESAIRFAIAREFRGGIPEVGNSGQGGWREHHENFNVPSDALSRAARGFRKALSLGVGRPALSRTCRYREDCQVLQLDPRRIDLRRQGRDGWHLRQRAPSERLWLHAVAQFYGL